MTNEFGKFHGIVFTTLIHHSKTEVSVQQYPSPDNSSYIVNGKVGLYIKYSTKRLSPWQFTFERRHKTTVLEMNRIHDKVVIAMVCRDDGVAGITFGELCEVLDLENDATEGVSVVRRPREQYAIRGSRGHLKYKIGMLDFCDKTLCATQPSRTS